MTIRRRRNLVLPFVRGFAAACLLAAVAAGCASGSGGTGADSATQTAGPAAAPPPSRTAQEVRFDPGETLVPVSEDVLEQLDPDRRFSLGLDQMVRDAWSPLDHQRVVVVTTRLAVDSEGRHLLETLLPERKPLVGHVIVFDDELPAPGRSRAMDRILGSYPEVRVFQRSASSPEPTARMLENMDVMVIDVPLRPARIYPETAFLAGAMAAASKSGLPVYVLDRPLAWKGDLFDGPVADASTHGRPDAWYPTVPVPGMTAGELAKLFNTKYGIGAELEVVPMLGWSRSMGWEPLLDTYERLDIDPGLALEEWDHYVTADPQQAAWRTVAKMLPEGMASVRTEEPGPDGLLIAPPAPAQAFADRLNELLGETATASVVMVQTEDPEAVPPVVLTSSETVPPATVAVTIWKAIAEQAPERLPAAGEPDPLAAPYIFQWLREGRTLPEIQRLWRLVPEWEDFSERRSDLLLYR